MNARVRFALPCALVLLAGVVRAQAPSVSDLGLLPGDMSIAPAVSHQQDHAVCKGGDRYLVVWSDYRGQSVGGGAAQSSVDVFGIRLDAQGNPVDAAPFLIAGGMGVQSRPLVAWNGSAWLVLYISQDPVGSYFDDEMRAVRVSAAGQVLDTTPIGFPPTQFTPSTVGMQVTGQNGQWLITRCVYHADGYGTYLAGQRIDANGALLDPTPLVLMDWIYGGTVSLAANGEYLVAGPDWTNFSLSRAQRVGQDGVPIGTPFTVPSLTIASSGSEYYVVWIRDFVNAVGSRMTGAGTLLTPLGTTILANATQFGQPTLAHDGTQWWLAWGVNDQLHSVRINAAGTVLDAGGGPMLPITIGGNVSTAYAPQLVGRTGGGALLFWHDYRIALGNDGNVFALPISATNVAGTERCVSTGTRSQRAPDLAAGPGDQSAVVFVSEASNDRRVLVHLLGADGHASTAAPIEVASGPTIGRAGIAWNGSLYLVTWDGGTTGDPLLQVEARRLRADGTFVDAAPFDVMTGFSPDVEALGEDFLVACCRVTGPQTISAFMRIVHGPTGAPVAGPTLLGGGFVSDGPRVHQDGSHWIVTYDSHWSHDANQSDAIYNLVNPDGSLPSAGAPAGTSGGSGTPDVAYSGGKYLFVWRNNTLANANNFIAGRIMNPDGTFATPGFVIAEAPGRQLRPVVGWDGTHFLVAWDDQRNQSAFFDERTNIYGARVSETGEVIDPAGFAIRAGSQGVATAALLTRPNGAAILASAGFLVAPPFDSYRIGVTSVGTAVLDAAGGAAPGAAPLTSAPNPFRKGTTIGFSLPQPGHVVLAILDTQGRRIRTLVDGVLPAGQRTAAWNRRDDAGARVPPGVYLAALRTPTLARTSRVVVLDD
jgi:hypothetical protein